MAYPNTPTSMFVNGSAEVAEKITRNTTGTIAVSAVINDPDNSQKIRLVVRYSTDKTFATYSTAVSTFSKTQGVRRSVNMTKLKPNTLYYIRAWTQDQNRALSVNYNASSVWTNRNPNPPELVSPDENYTFAATDPVVFDWTVSDPDDANLENPSAATAWRLEWRIAGNPLLPPGPWIVSSLATAATTTTVAAGAFQQSTTYEWRVKSRDTQRQWSDYSLIRSFTTEGVTQTPVPLSPAGDVALVVDEPQTFKWTFRDPLPEATQANADLRYRIYGTDTWIVDNGDALTEQERTFPAGTFFPGYRYEWQVRTMRSTGLDPDSDWSESGTFWSILTPGSLAGGGDPVGREVRGMLGVGKHRVFIFQRGGLVQRGEITQMSKVEWNRKRDDISSATIEITGYSDQCRELLGSVRTWAHEVVIYRGEDRVFEGPVTHITDTPGKFTIGAKDVMAYLYRRIMRQGYNDAYHLVAGQQRGLKTVVERAGLITVNALAYLDPNVLPYLTLVHTGADARQSRIVPDYSKSAWEEVDDLASNAGLDYTTVCRRIIYWDTHNHLGVLPEMRDEDFSEPLTVTEYGMSAANYYAVTDGQGAWGAAIPDGATEDDWYDFYGPLEQLASGYGDTTAAEETLTPNALAVMKADLEAQARRNINNRWPAPLVARVPDNATIRPTVNVGINQLIPGVWVPLRIENTVRKFAQMQKLDSLTVTEESLESGPSEKVNVVLSPAPIGAEDPDAVIDAEVE